MVVPPLLFERSTVMGDKSPKNNQKQKKQQDTKKAPTAKK
jgi:hypothetical protein